MKKEVGLKGKRGYKPPVFDESFKIALAREYIQGQLSFNQLAKKYNLPSADTVRWFVRWYKQWLEKQPVDNTPAPVTADNKTEVQQQLQQANLRITALEMLIQNAEKEFGIDIAKKPGTKQQSK
jgi:transposase-like protein